MLNFQQKTQLRDDGYVVVPGAISPLMIDNALRSINASVGDGMNVDEMDIFRAQSFCPELRDTPVIRDLFGKTPLFDIAQNLIGDGNVHFGRGQIALRFPLPDDFSQRQAPRVGWHLDGVPTHNNGVAPGALDSFTMLVGILLSDLPSENRGNFTVWPGSHHVLASHFARHDTNEAVARLHDLEMGEPRQIVGKAGDVVICHYQLAHGVAPNLSPYVRYTVFFRVKHPQHDAFKPQQLSNLWLEWEGIED